MANNLYRKQKRQYSTDNGVTWKDVTPAVYQVGALIETNSDCSAASGSIQYRWFAYDISDQYTCDTTTFTKYNLEVLQYSYDGITWLNTTETRQGSQRETNSCDCGYTEYKWVLEPDRYLCSDNSFTKYGVEVYKVGCGNRWVNVEPYQERETDEPIECYSLDCGMSSDEIIVTVENVDKYSKGIAILYKMENDSNNIVYCDYPLHNKQQCIDLTNSGTTVSLSVKDYLPCKDVIGIKLQGEGNASPCNYNTTKIKRIEKMMDTKYFKSFNDMFPSSVEFIDTTYINTENALNMYQMFYLCSGLTSLDVSHFNTSNVTNMSGMFQYCSGLTSLDVSGWNTENVTDMSRMFDSCVGLRNIDLSGWDFSSITNDSYNCNNTYTGNIGYMFSGLKDCTIKLNNISYSNNFFNLTNMRYDGKFTTFVDSENIKLDMLGLDSDIVGYFSLLSENEDVEIISDAIINKGGNTLKIHTSYGGGIQINGKDIELNDYKNVSSNTLAVYELTSPLTSITLNDNISISEMPDTSNITTMYEMFRACSFRQFPKGLFNSFASVKSMEKMFYGCGYLKYKLDLSGIVAPMLNYVSYMFYDCGALKEVDLSGMNPTITNGSCMFYNCSSLEKIDLSGWDFSNASFYEGWMFYGCNSLNEIVLNDVSLETFNAIRNELMKANIRPNITTNMGFVWD